MKLVNATPHAIVLLSKFGVEQDSKKQFVAEASSIRVMKEISPSGVLPCVAMTNTPVGEIDGVPVEAVVYGDIENLPSPKQGVFYIVSGLVAAAASRIGRSDCLAPGAIVRDKNNPSNVLGCLFLQKP